MDLAQGSASYTFNGFDTVGGTLTLTGVSITFTSKQRADVTVAYVDANADPAATKLVATSIVPEAPAAFSASITFADPSTTQIGINNFGAGQTETLTNGAAAFTLVDLNTGTPSASGSSTSSDLAYFTSSHSASIVSDGNILGTIAGTTVVTDVSNYWAEGEVTIEYTYSSAVPEPSSAMLGLLGAGFLAFRRKRA